MTLEEIKQKCSIEIRSREGESTYVSGISGAVNWDERIRLVKESPDNKLIPKHELAGKIHDGYLYLHNGIKVHKESYYGYCMLKMLVENEGVHEPQEEKAFHEVLKYIKPNGTMIELGSYWSFYSLWFKKFNKGKTIMVEPDIKNLEFGKMNFSLNEEEGFFYNKFVSSGKNDGTISVDELFELEKIDRLSICHSDIQGYEYQMLLGCTKNLDKIDYFFISTHGDTVHNDCMNFLKNNNFKILCSANGSETYSYDGLIVAKSNLVEGPEEIIISKR